VSSLIIHFKQTQTVLLTSIKLYHLSIRKVPIYLRAQAKQADQRGKTIGNEMKERHQKTLKEVDNHIRIAKAMNEDAIRQCALATEMATKAAKYSELAKHGMGNIQIEKK